MIRDARRPLTTMIIGEGARFAITVEQLSSALICSDILP